MTLGEYILCKSNGTSFDEKIILGVENKALGFDSSLNPVMLSIDTLARTAISLTTTGTAGAATYDNSTGILNIPQYSGGGGGGGVAVIAGTTILNFEFEKNKVVNTISSATITNASLKSATFVFQETATTSLDDFTLNGVTCNLENVVDNTSFDIRASAINNASGNYTVKYFIII